MRTAVVGIVAGCAGLVVGGAVTAYAATPSTVKVCVTKGNLVKSAKTSSKCPSHTKKVTINRVGPRGPRGPRGLTGPGTTAFGTDTGHDVEGKNEPSCIVGSISLTASPYQGAGVPADGRLLQIGQNQALFSLLGTTYGGDAQTTFALPDLRAAAPNHMTYLVCTDGIFPSEP